MNPPRSGSSVEVSCAGFQFSLAAFVVSISLLLIPGGAAAQEPPYFVAYSHAMEEPGNLEFTMRNTAASPRFGNPFGSATIEMEFGTAAWWTTEFYLSGQATGNDSAVFNGFRIENRFRPLLDEHWINPVLYVEYENVNKADRSLLEVVGHDSVEDLTVPNAIQRAETERSLETKLILSSNFRGWNISENFIAEKALNEGEPAEFGYAIGISRPFALAGSPRACTFCRENFTGALEFYGGLGTTDSFGWRGTSQYIGPVIAYSIPRGPTIAFSPNVGLNDNSLGVLYRFSVSYEVQQIFSHFQGGSR
jgi:hypothetical protein